jgi:hypothetical protein
MPGNRERGCSDDFVDSGRVTFNVDNSVSWMLGRHTYGCPCYLGGWTTPCYHDDPVVSQTTGTYTIVGDSIRLDLVGSPQPGAPNTVWLRTAIPDRVPKDWAEPDSVLYGLSNGFALILKPQ